MTASSSEQPTTIEADGAVLECSLVPWDSAIFGFPVAQVQRLDLAGRAASAALFASFEAWCAERGVRLASCRLDHAALAESMALEEHGFRFIELVYEPRFDGFADLSAPRRSVEVTEAGEADLEAIEAIAFSAFDTGRFLLDRRLPPELSRRRYATWVRNSFASTDQVVIKAEIDGALVGFFIVERRADDTVYWHLTAIAPGWQGRGVGMALWQTMLQRHRSEGATSVRTTISGHNLPALNLYARLGFTFDAAQMTFHRLVGPAPEPERASA